MKALDGLQPDNREISFWFQAAEAEEVLIEEIINEFNTGNGRNIRVKAYNLGFHEDLWESIAQAEEKPDILWLTADENKQLPWQDDSVDLFPYLAHREWGGDGIPDSLLEQLKAASGGYLVKNRKDEWSLPQIPVLRDPSLVFCNEERLAGLGFSEFPGTKEDFRKACEAAVLIDDVNGLIFPPDSRTLLTAAFADGWNPLDKEGRDRKNEESLFLSGEFLLSLNRAGVSKPAERRFEGQMEFSAGSYLFSMDSSSGMPFYRDSIRAAQKPFEWSVHPFPQTENGAVASWDRTALILSRTPEEALASWLFLKWSLSEDIQKRLGRITGTLPVNPQAVDELLKNTDSNDLYHRILEIGTEEVFLPFPWSRESEVFYDLVTEEFHKLLDLGVN